MAFIEEADLADMLSDTGVSVVWAPVEGPAVNRKGLAERHTEALDAGVEVPRKGEIATVLVERAYFDGIAVGDVVTVDGATRVVRELGLAMRSLLRIDLALGSG